GLRRSALLPSNRDVSIVAPPHSSTIDSATGRPLSSEPSTPSFDSRSTFSTDHGASPEASLRARRGLGDQQTLSSNNLAFPRLVSSADARATSPGFGHPYHLFRSRRLCKLYLSPLPSTSNRLSRHRPAASSLPLTIVPTLCPIALCVTRTHFLPYLPFRASGAYRAYRDMREIRFCWIPHGPKASLSSLHSGNAAGRNHFARLPRYTPGPRPGR
ncbi:hypothetical protein C8F01DRAFT_1338546, partial [Mycena amicta]